MNEQRKVKILIHRQRGEKRRVYEFSKKGGKRYLRKKDEFSGRFFREKEKEQKKLGQSYRLSKQTRRVGCRLGYLKGNRQHSYSSNYRKKRDRRSIGGKTKKR